MAWTCKHIRDNPLTRNCKVTFLHHYQECNRPYHEYLVATIVILGPGHQATRYIKIERTVTPQDTQSAISSSSTMHANDIIWMLEQWPHPHATPDPYFLRESLQFSDLALADLCGLLSQVTDLAPNYHPVGMQCYWMAWIVTKVAHVLWAPTLMPAPEVEQHRMARAVGSMLAPSTQDSSLINQLLHLYASLPDPAYIQHNAAEQARINSE